MCEITIETLAEKTGKSKRTIYNLAKKLNRLPTIDEIQQVKLGRPKKYK